MKTKLNKQQTKVASVTKTLKTVLSVQNLFLCTKYVNETFLFSSAIASVKWSWMAYGIDALLYKLFTWEAIKVEFRCKCEYSDNQLFVVHGERALIDRTLAHVHNTSKAHVAWEGGGSVNLPTVW